MSTPSPRPKWSARMGSVMRRTSSVLAISRPSTPSIASDRDSDASSLKRVDTNLAPPAVQKIVAPSPIAESPAREAAASQDNIPTGPSPLAQETVTASPEPIQDATSPVGYIPPPVLDSSVGNPGAFTDEPEELPQPLVISDPYAPKAESTHDTVPPSEAREDAPAIPDSTPAPPTVNDAERAPTLDSVPSYFEPEVEDLKVNEPVEQPTREFIEAVQENSPVKDSDVASHHSINPLPDNRSIHQADADAPIEAPVPEPSDAPQYTAVPAPAPERDQSSDVPQYTILPVPTQELAQPSSEPIYTTMPVPAHEEPAPSSDAPVYTIMPVPSHEDTSQTTSPPIFTIPNYDMHSSSEIWGGDASKGVEEHREVPFPATNGNASPHSHVPSTHIPDDPFADPVVPRIAVTHDDDMYMPEVHTSGSHNHTPYEVHDADERVVMPLPPINQVIPNKSLYVNPSTQSLAGTRHQGDTDETRPLLSQPGSPKNVSYLQPSVQHHVTVSPQSPMTSTSTWGSTAPRLHELGWLEYHLPDSTFYYVHPTRRVTTDVNIRVDRVLNAVTAYFEEHKDSANAPVGTELWLRDVGTPKRGFVPARSWVDHHTRTVIIERAQDGRGKKKYVEDDPLDMEFRYWSFMEAHPAHNTLPAKAKSEALDVLTWAWTDRLLPSHSQVPAPFTQDECQELMSLLRSFTSDSQGDLGIQTRIVSRILLRVAHWRQSYFRPNKPLPNDIGIPEPRVPARRRSFRRATLDFVVSCLCLGIPWIFFERTQHHRIDEESGLRNATPILVMGACTCLVAAIVLSASVTFLSLPGLDGIARIAGLVAILFATFSMASTILAVFRYKADMERPTSHVGVEGLVMLSRRSVILSLPVVFLAYAIIGFVTGIVLYSFRGVSISDPASVQNHFTDFTRWTVVGVLGALAGMLTTSFLLLRR